MNIGNKLKELRAAADQSQETVAEALGLSRQAVQKWEAGDSPTADNLVALSRHFSVTVDELLAEPPAEGRTT